MTNQLTHQDRIQALTDKIDELLPLPKYVNTGGVDVLIHHGTRNIDALDILRALKVLRPKDTFAVDNNGYLFIIDGDDCGNTFTKDIDEYPLDKSMAEFPESRTESLYKLFFE